MTALRTITLGLSATRTHCNGGLWDRRDYAGGALFVHSSAIMEHAVVARPRMVATHNVEELGVPTKYGILEPILKQRSPA